MSILITSSLLMFAQHISLWIHAINLVSTTLVATEAFPVSHHDEHYAVNILEVQYYTRVIGDPGCNTMANEDYFHRCARTSVVDYNPWPFSCCHYLTSMALLYFICWSTFDGNEHNNHVLLGFQPSTGSHRVGHSSQDGLSLLYL